MMIANRTDAPMSTARRDAASATGLWAGRILSGLIVVFLLFDAIRKVLKLDPSVEGTTELGYPESVVVWIGLVLLACAVLYVVPTTSFFGAILLTGYLGGAIATNVRVEEAWFIMPAVMAVLIWIGLVLSDDRFRAFLTR